MGALIGFVSGLLGAGGAFLSVPFMLRGNVPVRQAVATSAALGFFIALANSVGYILVGSGQLGQPSGYDRIYLLARSVDCVGHQYLHRTLGGEPGTQN